MWMWNINQSSKRMTILTVKSGVNSRRFDCKCGRIRHHLSCFKWTVMGLTTIVCVLGSLRMLSILNCFEPLFPYVISGALILMWYEMTFKPHNREYDMRAHVCRNNRIVNFIVYPHCSHSVPLELCHST